MNLNLLLACYFSSWFVDAKYYLKYYLPNITFYLINKCHGAYFLERGFFKITLCPFDGNEISFRYFKNKSLNFSLNFFKSKFFLTSLTIFVTVKHLIETSVYLVVIEWRLSLILVKKWDACSRMTINQEPYLIRKLKLAIHSCWNSR